jgi:hypothetical protein
VHSQRTTFLKQNQAASVGDNMDKNLLTLLRVFLVTAAFGWGISVGGVFMPWSIVSAQLQAMGARNIPSDPMIIYWLRMASAAFTFIGLLFLLAASTPANMPPSFRCWRYSCSWKESPSSSLASPSVVPSHSGPTASTVSSPVPQS